MEVNEIVGQLRITSSDGSSVHTDVSAWTGSEWIPLRGLTGIVLSVEATELWKAELSVYGIRVDLTFPLDQRSEDELRRVFRPPLMTKEAQEQFVRDWCAAGPGERRWIDDGGE